jgi:hypothetical protein
MSRFSNHDGSPTSIGATVIPDMQQYFVTDVRRSGSPTQLTSAFNDFLFAAVAEGSNGLPLSVLSALARLGLDPWQEAATLAGLPQEEAIQRLTNLIAALPGGTPTRPGPATNIAGLIASLPLPHRADPIIAVPHRLFLVGTTSNSRVIVYVLFVLVMLGTQWIVASHESAPPNETSPAHAITAAPAPAPSADR